MQTMKRWIANKNMKRHKLSQNSVLFRERVFHTNI